MIDHIKFGVSDYAKSLAFYDEVLAPLGIRRLYEDPAGNSAGYGDDRPGFWISAQDAVRG